MKKLSLSILLIMVGQLTFGQDQNFERTTYYELKARANSGK